MIRKEPLPDDISNRRLIYHTNDPVPTLILEDLSVTGYEMLNRTLDYTGANLVAQRLAKFHAASVYLQANVGSNIPLIYY